MRTGSGDLTFPVPWAETSATSAVASPEIYWSALENAGFTTTAERNRQQYALDFFAKLSAKAASADGPPPLGLHVLMGATRAEKIKKIVENIVAGRIAPVELIASK
jgi:hypothetical protein